jgi:hypothetical protein
VISLKGEEKSRQQKQCYYGADGALQKVTMSATPPPQEKRGDAVSLDVRFSSLQDGTGYPAGEVLVASAKKLSVNITNSGYRKATR